MLMKAPKKGAAPCRAYDVSGSAAACLTLPGKKKKQPNPNGCFFFWRRYFLFLMGCNKKLYIMYWGGVYGYYNTMAGKISVNKDAENFLKFLYNMQGYKNSSFFLVCDKIYKTPGNIEY